MRSSESTTSPLVAVAAPASPVRPPDGTIATPCAAQARTTACTSARLPGNTISEGRTGQPPRQRSLP
jgi:hypothetical protein